MHVAAGGIPASASPGRTQGSPRVTQPRLCTRRLPKEEPCGKDGTTYLSSSLWVVNLLSPYPSMLTWLLLLSSNMSIYLSELTVGYAAGIIALAIFAGTFACHFIGYDADLNKCLVQLWCPTVLTFILAAILRDTETAATWCTPYLAWGILPPEYCH